MYRAIAVWEERVAVDVPRGVPDVVYEIAKEAFGNTPGDALAIVQLEFDSYPKEIHIMEES